MKYQRLIGEREIAPTREDTKHILENRKRGGKGKEEKEGVNTYKESITELKETTTPIKTVTTI